MNRFGKFFLSGVMVCMSLAITIALCYISYRCFEVKLLFQTIMGCVLVVVAMAQFYTALYVSYKVVEEELE